MRTGYRAGLVGGVLWLIACARAASGQGLIVHAMTGQPVAGGLEGEVYSSFPNVSGGSGLRTMPRINNGHIVFRARTSVEENLRGPYIVGLPGEPVVAFAMSAGTGIPGVLFSYPYSYDNMTRITADGRVAFFSQLEGEGVTPFNNEALFAVSNGQARVLVREGDHVLGMANVSVLRGETLGSLTDNLRRWSYSMDGAAVFSARVTVTETFASAAASFVSTGDSLSVTVRGYGSPSYPGHLIDGWRVHNYFTSSTISDSGYVALGVDFENSGDGVVVKRAGTARVAFHPNMPAPGLPGVVMRASSSMFLSNTAIGLNNQGQVGVAVQLRQGTQSLGGAVLRAGESLVEIVAKAGDAKPGLPGQYFSTTDLLDARVLVAHDGSVAFVDQSRRGVWIGQSLADLQRAFDPISAAWPAGLGQPLVVPDTIGMNAANQLVAALTFPTSPATTAVAGWDPVAGNILIAYTGQTIEVLPGVFRTISSPNINGQDGVHSGGGEDGRPNSLDNAGRIVFTAHFTNNESAVLVATIPAPAGGVIVGFGMLVCARRRR